MDDEQFAHQLISAIDDADVISLFFPLLRRALVIDARSSPDYPPSVTLMPQVASVEERIRMIEGQRPGMGKVRAILAVPWLRSVRELDDRGIVTVLVNRLVASGLSREASRSRLEKAVDKLWRIEKMAFAGMIRGEGFSTIWTVPR